MSEHFEENVRFVQDWVSGMQTLCPAEQAEDFEWIIEVLSAELRAWQFQEASGLDREIGETLRLCERSQKPEVRSQKK